MKKLLSIILALAMIVSLIPAVFAADTEADAGIKIVYNFQDKVTVEKNATVPTGNATISIDPDVFSYGASKGFWQYAANLYYNSKSYATSEHSAITDKTGGIRLYTTAIIDADGDGVLDEAETDLYCFGVAASYINDDLWKGNWIAFKLYVPKSGKYNMQVSLNYAANYYDTYLDAFIFKTDDASLQGNTIQEKIISGCNNKNRRQSADFDRKTKNIESMTLEPMNLEEGEYYFVFKPTNNEKEQKERSFTRLLSLTLTEGDGSLTVPIISNIAKTANEDGTTTVTATAAKMSDNTAATDVTYTYSVAADDAEIASVDANGVVTGLADGTATIIATATKNGQSSLKSIEVAVTAPVLEPEEDEELTDAFDDIVVSSAPSDYIAPSVDAIDAEGIVGEPVKTSNGAYRITAPETAGERGNFLYWKKAMTVNEKIVSFDREFSYVPEGEGRNILVAVYEGDVTSTNPKCYNANGQYLPDATPIDADLPSMAGYGKASAWEQFGETNVYVAQYDATTPIADIEVTVVGDNTSGGGTNLAYGANVTCTATGENFKCWKKTYGDGTSKIVSTENVYSFKVWEDCMVTAIYDENVYYTGSLMKIIIDSFVAGGENGIMAEFLGFEDNVVEKGIMLNGNRIAMTTPSNQFSIIADEEGTYAGYAIVEDDEGLKLITDGSYENK